MRFMYKYEMNKMSKYILILNRPGVAGAVPQTPLSLTD